MDEVRHVLHHNPFGETSEQAPSNEPEETAAREAASRLHAVPYLTSFVLMENLGIRKALAFDANFRQAGFAMFP